MNKKELLNEINKYGAPKPPNDLRKDELISYAESARKTWEDCKPQDIFVKGRQKSLDYVPVCRESELHWLDHFDKYGWSTVPVTGLNVEKTVDSFYEWLESCDERFDREDPKTWSYTPMNYHGIFKQGVGHEEFVWNVREKTYPLFQEYWEEDDLLTSFDGACFLPHKKDNGWLHCDHPRVLEKTEAVQGLVNLLDNGPEDGGLFLIEGSDKKYSQFLRQHPLTGYGGYQFKVDPEDPAIKECRRVKVCAKPGELIIWDGHTFHCNVAPKKKNTLRMCVYVSMQPRKDCPEKTLRKRIKAFEDKRMTSHFCYGRSFNVNSAKAYDYGQDLPQPRVPNVKLNNIRKKLIGY